MTDPVPPGAGPDGGGASPAPESEELARIRAERQRTVGRSKELYVHLDQLCRLLVVHSSRNDAITTVLERVAEDVEYLLGVQGGALACTFAEGHSFVNGVWIRADRRTFDSTRFLTDRMEALEARGFLIPAGLSGEQILAFADAIRDRTKEDAKLSPEERRTKAEKAIDEIPGVQLIRRPEDTATSMVSSPKGHAQALSVFREGVGSLSASDLLSLDVSLRRRQRILVRKLIDLAEDSPEALLALTTVRDLGAQTEVHSLMVCIYAVALGRLFDLKRKDLLQLGMAALNHNLGESLIEKRMFEIEREYRPTERALIQRHPLLGVDHLLTHYALDHETAMRAIVSAEHHLHWDRVGGYPFQPFLEPHAFSRIIQVADVFDALVTRRPHRPAYPPDQAMKILGRAKGKEFDPLIVRSFSRLVGRYPPGSLVELDTGEWAIVVGPGEGLDPLQRPQVLLVSDEELVELPTPMAVDLGERHPTRRAWLRTIARTRDPELLPAPPATYLFGERIEIPSVKLDRQDPSAVKRMERMREAARQRAEGAPPPPDPEVVVAEPVPGDS